MQHKQVSSQSRRFLREHAKLYITAYPYFPSCRLRMKRIPVSVPRHTDEDALPISVNAVEDEDEAHLFPMRQYHRTVIALLALKYRLTV